MTAAAMDERHATDQYLTALLDAAQEVAIIATDADGRISAFNRGAENMLGYSFDDMQGQSPLLLHRASEVARRSAELTMASGCVISGFEALVAPVRAGGSDSRSWTYVCKDRRCLRVSVTVSAVRGADHAVIGFLAVARDISEQLKAEASLVKLNLELEQLVQERTEALQATANELQAVLLDLRSTQGQLVQAANMASLGGLVAGISHEINTPIGIAVTSASALQWASAQLRQAMDGGTLRKSEMQAYINMAEGSSQLILKNAERAASLIRSFKQVAVDQTSEMRRVYPLREYLDEVMRSLHPALQRARVQVAIDCSDDIRIDGYPGAMAQVLTNLTMNAIAHAFAPGGPGHIAIAARCSAGQVHLTFCDDGRGIDAEHIAKVFDPFFTTKRGEGGTGLGLNIVYNIVHTQFGGSLTLDSAPGEGTVFHLKFPIVCA